MSPIESRSDAREPWILLSMLTYTTACYYLAHWIQSCVVVFSRRWKQKRVWLMWLACSVVLELAPGQFHRRRSIMVPVRRRPDSRKCSMKWAHTNMTTVSFINNLRPFQLPIGQQGFPRAMMANWGKRGLWCNGHNEHRFDSRSRCRATAPTTDAPTMCGVIGILLANRDARVSQELYDGLTILQHRGQDAAGIATSDGRKLHLRKEKGLVRAWLESG